MSRYQLMDREIVQSYYRSIDVDDLVLGGVDNCWMLAILVTDIKHQPNKGLLAMGRKEERMWIHTELQNRVTMYL
jgi:hypothetical protein